jgi:phytoene dehydrogenase-like protein
VAQPFRPPATHRVYDACVVGSQLGGVLAGALLARRGYRVLHVDHDGLGPSYEDRGWVLPYVPALLPSPRLFPAAEAALSELGLLTDVQRALEAPGPDLQLLLPRARLDLAREPARRAAELRREWPDDAARLEAALADLAQRFERATPFLKARPPLPPAGLQERWALWSALRAAPALPAGAAAPFAGLEAQPLVRGLRTLARFLGYMDGELAPLAAVRLLGAAVRGSHRIPGGLEALRELVRRKIADSRGELLGGEGGAAIAESLSFEGRRVTTVRVAGSKDDYAARVFLLATDAPAVRRLLPEAEREGKRGRLLRGLRADRQVVAVNWVVRPEALPPGLGDTALVLPAGSGDGDGVLLQVSPARRPAGKADGREAAKVICAAAFLPAAIRDQGEAALAEWAGRVRASLADVLPFLDRHILLESLPLLSALPGRRGSRLMPHPLYRAADPGALGITGLPARSPWKNLVFAGREVVPGLGVEGEFHAGLQAAAAAERLLGKSGRPR